MQCNALHCITGQVRSGQVRSVQCSANCYNCHVQICIFLGNVDNYAGGLLLLGGYNAVLNEGMTLLSRVEIFGSSQDCTVHSLAYPMSFHASFVVNNQLAVCAGVDGVSCVHGDRYPSGAFCSATKQNDKCHLLNTKTQSWEEGWLELDFYYVTILFGKIQGPVEQVNLPTIGVYVIQQDHTSLQIYFLEAGSGHRHWVWGPNLQEQLFTCAFPVSETSFMIVAGKNRHIFNTDIAGPVSNSGWRSSRGFHTARVGAACAVIGDKALVAGGQAPDTRNVYNEPNPNLPLDTVDILDLKRNTVHSQGGRMKKPRINFQVKPKKLH